MQKIKEGKTKIIFDGPPTIIINTKDQLSSGDGAKVANINNIGVEKTKQTSNIFSFLNNNNIPTAFIKQLSDTNILCFDCEMLPIEFVIRRYAWGSLLKREPYYKEYYEKEEIPYVFIQPKIELYHKKTIVEKNKNNKLISEDKARKLYLKHNKWPPNIHTDPIIITNDDKWELFSRLKSHTHPLLQIQPILDKKTLQKCKYILLNTFLLLEKKLHIINATGQHLTLADIKIEIGKRKYDDMYVIADVIDNDSWRIWPGANPKEQLDKQCFRDGDPLSQVQNNYELVTKITETLIKQT